MKSKACTFDKNSNIIDSDKLPDVDALIFEKGEELRLLCFSAGYRCVLAVEQRYNKTIRTGWSSKGTADGFKMCNLLKDAIRESYSEDIN